LGVGGEKLIVENANVCRDETVQSCEEGKDRAIGSDEIGTTDAVDTVSTRSQSAMESRFEAVEALAGGRINVYARGRAELGEHGINGPWDIVVRNGGSRGRPSGKSELRRSWRIGNR